MPARITRLTPLERLQRRRVAVPITESARVAFLEAALERVDEGFTIYDGELRLVAWNTRVFDLLDLPRSLAYIGAPFEDFVRDIALRGEYGPGDIDEMIRSRVERALRFVPHVMERVRPSGQVIEVRGNPVPGGGFITIYKDVTERKRTERALNDMVANLERRVQERTALLEAEIIRRREADDSRAASERWIRLIADAVPVLIGYVDEARAYRFANQLYADWFGLSPEAIVGNGVREVFIDPLYPGQWDDIEAVFQGETIAREITLRKPNGRTIEVALQYLPHFDEGGRAIGYFILAHDQTHRKEAERSLNQAQKMEAVGLLTGGLAHDFNNLLTVIMGNLTLAAEDETIPAEGREMVAAALDAARRGADLVRRLLAFSRRKTLRAEIYDPRAIVAGMASLLARTLGDAIQLDLALAPGGWRVDSDPNELENALLNMALNARDAMPDGGRLTIRVEERRVDGAPFVAVVVSDTGHGMPAEVREHAFEPFFTSKGPGRGTGLGLAMVYGFVRRSGGTARIRSDVGQGCDIDLLLPAKPPAPAAVPPRRRDRTVPTGDERILLVEDDARVRAFALRSLRALGYQVSAAGDGRQAMAMLKDDADFHLVVSDIEMPDGVSGIDLAQEIDARLPVLLMSGNPDGAMARGQGLNRRWHFLSKPFARADLARAVRDALDTAEGQR